jgi:PAS domain S-box-containing protein
MHYKEDRSQDELLLEIEKLSAQLAGTEERGLLHHDVLLAQEQVTTVLESITDAFLMFDHMWKVIRMNQKAEQLLRKNRDDIVGRIYWEVFPDAVDTISYRELHKAMVEQVAVSYEQFYPILNMWFEVRGYPSRDGIFVFFMDITERKRTEKSVLESEKKFKAISSSAKDTIIMMDNEGNISYWNEAAEKVFGYSVQEALGKELHIFLAHKKYHDAYRRGFLIFKVKGYGPVIGKTLELEAVRKDGTGFPIELSVSAVRIEEKWHAIGIVRDITQRKKAEEERETLIRELQDALTERKKAQQELEETIERLELYTTRVNSLMVTMLGQATDKNTKVVILDISGVAIDAEITEPLVNLARLSKLLGATCIVTGIKSEAVNKIADLGVKLSPITTEQSLKEGLQYTIAIVE